MSNKNHVLMVPFPMQGHVIPMMELAQCLAKHGLRITFVNTEIIHERIINAFSDEERLDDRICLVSVSDGLESWERNIPGKMTETIYNTMPQKIEKLIKEKYDNEEDDEKFTCVIHDQSIGSIQEVVKKMGIRSVVFLPAAAALLVLGFNIPKLIEDGLIDSEGTPIKNQMVQFAPTIPIMSPSDFIWNRIKISKLQKLLFKIMNSNNKPTKSADKIICNSVHNLEPGSFTLAQEIIPIGPLHQFANSQGHFWAQDTTCLDWLDHQPPSSVIYIAFGSSTIFTPVQIQELAIGLELTNRPFLWVVRPDFTFGDQNFLEGFLDRVSGRGRVVDWAPQQKVLGHSSIACFLSHCGWNSTLESVSNGVPVLCWPYFADQFLNQSYICDIWKVGLKFEEGDGGMVTRDEVKKKVDELLIGENLFKERALELREMISSSGSEGGSSHENLENFINWIKE